MATIVTPGTVVGTADKNSPGKGTAEENGNLIALLTGVVSEIDGVISVHTHNEMLRVQVGDTVIGEVVKLNEKSGEIRIISVEGKQTAQSWLTKNMLNSRNQNTDDSFTTRDDCAAVISFEQKSSCWERDRICVKTMTVVFCGHYVHLRRHI